MFADRDIKLGERNDRSRSETGDWSDYDDRAVVRGIRNGVAASLTLWAAGSLIVWLLW